MKNPPPAPPLEQNLKIIDGDPPFSRHRARFKKTHPHLDDELKAAYAEIRSAYAKVRNGAPIYLHANQSELGASLGDGIFKKRIATNSTGKSGALRAVYKINQTTHVACMLILFAKNEKSTIVAGEINRAMRIYEDFTRRLEESAAKEAAARKPR